MPIGDQPCDAVLAVESFVRHSVVAHRCHVRGTSGITAQDAVVLVGIVGDRLRHLSDLIACHVLHVLGCDGVELGSHFGLGILYQMSEHLFGIV